MTQIQTLSELQPGQSATVRSVCAPDGMQRRLRDLGLIENTRVSHSDGAFAPAIVSHSTPASPSSMTG